MMKTYGLLIIIATISMILSACTTPAAWKSIDAGGSQYANEYYTAILPTGWMMKDADDTLMISRDGPDLQRIVIAYVSLEEALSDEDKKSVSKMLPSELADKFISELKSSQDFDLPSLTILSNEPIPIAGHTGFQLHLMYSTDKGLRIEMLSVGFVDEDGFYSISYRAPALHYFANDRDQFTSVVSSFQPQ